jgi:hypothetical protein
MPNCPWDKKPEEIPEAYRNLWNIKLNKNGKPVSFFHSVIFSDPCFREAVKRRDESKEKYIPLERYSYLD